jgi:sulfide:quinone oxidoreductase
VTGQLQAVIVGAGFGGMAVAAWLRRLTGPGTLAITVVDPMPYMTYRPGLVHALDRDVWRAVRQTRVSREALWRRLHVTPRMDTVIAIDPERRRVELAASPFLPYDVLFLAPGHRNAWEQVPGLDPRRGGLCEDGLARHTGVRLREWRGGRFVFAVGRLLGSPDWDPPLVAGCECPALEAALLFEAWLSRHGHRQDSELVVLTPAARVGADAGGPAQERLEALLAARGIRVITGAEVRGVDDETFDLGSERLSYDQAVWLPPMAGWPWLAAGGVGDAYGFVPVDGYLRHPRYPDLYAVGDVVSRPWPKMGHTAMVQARVATRHWMATRTRRPPPAPYEPTTLWLMETGHGAGLFVLSNLTYGGRRHLVQVGRWPVWAKSAFQVAYAWTRGALPVMP